MRPDSANSEGSGGNLDLVVRPKFSLEVGTRWYKALEMLFGSKEYDQSVDIWAIGCIFAELMSNEPLFKGMNDIEQIVLIIKTLGTPTKESWPEFEQLPDFHKIVIPKTLE
jgi:cell cycle related kinase